jgi:hypothetical protein
MKLPEVKGALSALPPIQPLIGRLERVTVRADHPQVLGPVVAPTAVDVIGNQRNNAGERINLRPSTQFALVASALPQPSSDGIADGEVRRKAVILACQPTIHPLLMFRRLHTREVAVSLFRSADFLPTKTTLAARFTGRRHKTILPILNLIWRLRSDSNRRSADYKSAALITMLRSPEKRCSTPELHRPFWGSFSPSYVTFLCHRPRFEPKHSCLQNTEGPSSGTPSLPRLRGQEGTRADGFLMSRLVSCGDDSSAQDYNLADIIAEFAGAVLAA